MGHAVKPEAIFHELHYSLVCPFLRICLVQSYVFTVVGISHFFSKLRRGKKAPATVDSSFLGNDDDV